MPSQTQTTSARAQSLPQSNEAVVRRFIERVVNGHEYGIIPELFGPAYTLHLPGAGPMHGSESVHRVAQMFQAAFPDWKNDLDRLVVASHGDYVFTRWYESGTHQGEFDGIPPSGRRVALEGTDMFLLKDGKIVEQWLETDMGGFRRALQGLPEERAVTRSATPGVNPDWVRRMKRDIIDGHDPAAAARYFAPGFAARNPIPGRAPGLVGLQAALKEFFAAFPDVQESVDDVVVEGDRLALVGTIRGTHMGPFAGVPATRRPVAFNIFELHRLENGKIAEGWVFLDVAAALQQIAPSR